MRVKPPPDRRKFVNAWDEIEYLYDKLLYWLYQREDTAHARRYAERLERILSQADPQRGTILGEECRSLIWEARGNLTKAIDHRENEIRLIRRLQEQVRNTPQEAVALRDYGHDAVSDRLDLLATLYHANHDLEKALSLLAESRRLCEARGIPFDGEDLLQDYQKEKTPLPGNGREPRRDSKRR